jgi:nitrogen regulatory protein PII
VRRVEAHIPAQLLTVVKERLELIGIAGMTAVSCAGEGPVSDEVYRGAVLRSTHADLVRLDVVASDEMADSIVRAVITVVRRHDLADGRIAIAPVDEVVRISTGQTGADAL